MKDKYFQLIVKHLSGETNQEEEQRFKILLEENDEFKQEFESLTVVWNKVELKGTDFDLERIKQLINKKIYTSRFSIGKLLRYAAIFVGTLFFVSFLQHKLSFEKIVVPENGELSHITLPDQTNVTINKGGEVSYYKRSMLGFFNRAITLNGEAYFDVAKSQTRKFVIQTNHFDITVHGTEFNVRTNPKKSYLVLIEGSVEISGLDNLGDEVRMIKPGEIFSYSEGNHTIIHHEVNTNIYTAWKEKRLYFDNFDLNDLALVIDLHLNKKLIIQNQNFNHVRLGGSAPIDDINLIVKALSEILNIDLIQRNDSIFIP